MNLFFVRRSASTLWQEEALTTTHVEEVHQAVQQETANSILRALCTKEEANRPQNIAHFYQAEVEKMACL